MPKPPLRKETTMSTLIARDLFLRLTDPQGRHKDVITHHRVWDGAAFVAAQVEQHDGPNTKPEDRRLVTVATRADYINCRH